MSRSSVPYGTFGQRLKGRNGNLQADTKPWLGMPVCLSVPDLTPACARAEKLPSRDLLEGSGSYLTIEPPPPNPEKFWIYLCRRRWSRLRQDVEAGTHQQSTALTAPLSIVGHKGFSKQPARRHGPCRTKEWRGSPCCSKQRLTRAWEACPACLGPTIEKAMLPFALTRYRLSRESCTEHISDALCRVYIMSPESKKMSAHVA